MKKNHEHPASVAWNLFLVARAALSVARAANNAAKKAFEDALITWRGCGKPPGEMEQVVNKLMNESSTTFCARMYAKKAYDEAEMALIKAISESAAASVEDTTTDDYYDDDRLWRRPRHRYHRRNVRR